ncbi:DUF2231 domain-containing protein [Micromonospora narathiwatensis]|uniref:DUF2231 domain-containing protein n=1 Tax=Micromonospora narathiwatensis TaxID=299146 RepID=A0A1A9ADR0_9ACTN|nr:DUF2231 domain-containing protein [Micromonospora narathiwatensis]SBT54246.1 hypothetical protein GA0070621_5279 [Micromonospora narathiwatensis]
MPDTVNGLPLHPLVVHAVVVLLPLAALGVVALAVRPSWRGRFGVLVVAIAALATAAIPLATDSGESLERRVGDPGQHAELGDTLLWFALPLLVVAVALVWLHRRASRPGGGATEAVRTSGRGVLGVVVAVLAVVVAAANLVQVYRVGDSGAKAVWGDTPAATAGHGGERD